MARVKKPKFKVITPPKGKKPQPKVREALRKFEAEIEKFAAKGGLPSFMEGEIIRK